MAETAEELSVGVAASIALNIEIDIAHYCIREYDPAIRYPSKTWPRFLEKAKAWLSLATPIIQFAELFFRVFGR